MPRTREPLSTERVLRAALALADAGGTDALSMRRLGQDLGVEAMSLYKHVANKDAILDGIADLVVSEIALPEPGDGWKAAMRERGISAHEVLLRHPWACALLMSRPNVGPAMLRYANSTLGTLRGAGFSVRLADHAWNAMDSHIYGYTLQKLNFPFDPGQYAEAAGTYLPRLPDGAYPHLAEMAVTVMEGGYDGVVGFTFGLDLILDGLERLLAAEL
ncbi:TetR/AcrR family transcriptional regulator C-terminal domain-containing protein [Phytohabitans flavus]|uniref:TetR/AcrR family transcriptional regulator C-terminal domain-containing protein n=1 Tax=Phytohabitans flavus TaxID=1076124 RepID=UPI0031F04D29